MHWDFSEECQIWKPFVPIRLTLANWISVVYQSHYLLSPLVASAILVIACWLHSFLRNQLSVTHISPLLWSPTGLGAEENGGRERAHPEGLRTLLWPLHRQRRPGGRLPQPTGGARETVHRAAVGARQLGLLKVAEKVAGNWPGVRGHRSKEESVQVAAR